MIVATVPCRNEAWIAGLSLRAMLMFCDAIVILDHCSTDETPDIISDVSREHPGRVHVIRETEPVWEEMRHRQRLLETARSIGATHIALVDADEVLTGDLLPVIRQMVYACPPAATMQLPWLCLRDSKDLVHVSGVWGEQNASMAFQDAPHLHWSSASRAGFDFHHRPPMGRSYAPFSPVKGRQSGLMHLQFLDGDRLRYKQLAYCLLEKSRWPGRETSDQIRKKYSLSIYGKDGPPAMDFGLKECPQGWWSAYAPIMKHLNPQLEPWQAQQCRDLLAANPGIEEGLDDFGTGLFQAKQL